MRLSLFLLPLIFSISCGKEQSAKQGIQLVSNTVMTQVPLGYVGMFKSVNTWEDELLAEGFYTITRGNLRNLYIISTTCSGKSTVDVISSDNQTAKVSLDILSSMNIDSVSKFKDIADSVTSSFSAEHTYTISSATLYSEYLSPWVGFPTKGVCDDYLATDFQSQWSTITTNIDTQLKSYILLPNLHLTVDETTISLQEGF